MTSHPSLNPFITAYAQGKDTTSSLGPHRQQPGWSILDNHIRMRCERRWSWKVREISEGVLYWLVFSLNINLFVRILIYTVWKGDHYPNLPQPLPIIMRKKLSWDDLYQYLQTWSSLHTFRERYPGTEDISRKVWDDLRREWEDGKEEVQIEFHLAVPLAKRV